MFRVGFSQEERLPNPLSIFILPPTLKLLWDRLEGRGSDDLATRWVRFQNAYNEIKEAHEYENFIINDDLHEAYSELKKYYKNWQTRA